MRRENQRARLTTADSVSFQGVWGYCAVVGTRELMWSGYRIPHPASLPDLDAYLASLRQGLSLESARSRGIFTEGAICWLADGLVEATRQEVNRTQDPACGNEEIELMATALACLAERRFFVVLLERDHDKQALRASVEAMAVTSPEDARDYVLHHPRVLALEAEGMRRQRAADPGAPREAQSALFTCERLHGLVN